MTEQTLTIRATIRARFSNYSDVLIGDAAVMLTHGALAMATVPMPTGPFVASLTDDPEDSSRVAYGVDGPEGSVCMVTTPADEAEATADRIAAALNVFDMLTAPNAAERIARAIDPHWWRAYDGKGERGSGTPAALATERESRIAKGHRVLAELGR